MLIFFVILNLLCWFDPANTYGALNLLFAAFCFGLAAGRCASSIICRSVT